MPSCLFACLIKLGSDPAILLSSTSTSAPHGANSLDISNTRFRAGRYPARHKERDELEGHLDGFAMGGGGHVGGEGGLLVT
jgi:hypothetical protein